MPGRPGQTGSQHSFGLDNFWRSSDVGDKVDVTVVTVVERLLRAPEAAAEPGVDLRERISASWEQLTTSQRRVAAYVSENTSEVLFLSVRELAARSGTSTATIVRFAQTIGFSGYPALLNEIQGQLLKLAYPTRRLSATISEIDETIDHESGVLIHTFRRDIASIEETLNLVSDADFVAAVDLLDRARIAYVVGTGLSSGPIGTLAFRLRRLSKPVIEVTTTGPDFYNAVLPMAPGDLLVAVGFQPIPREVLRTVELANERGIAVLAVTDTHISPLHDRATVALHAKRGPLTQLTSVVAPVALANALAVALAVRRKDQAAGVYDDYERLIGRDMEKQTGGEDQ